jgi:tetratricopeptide (TPR) repeat protein/serine phosphatase RsbU (regulator of sigma subunit)
MFLYYSNFRRVRKITFILFTLLSITLCAQEDTRLQQWNDSSLPDSVRYEALNSKIWDLFFTIPDSAEQLALVQLEYANSTDNKVQIADAFNSLGISFTVRGQNEKAIENFTKCLELNIQLEDLKGEGAAYNNIGMVHNNQGDFYRAIAFYEKSLRIDIQLDDDHGRAASLGNIGIIYTHQKEYEKALEYHLKSLELDIKNGDSRGIADTYVNMAVGYRSLANYEEALIHAKLALAAYSEIEDKAGLALSYQNIGSVYHETKNYEEALAQFEKGMELKKELGDNSGISLLSSNFGYLYLDMRNYKKAIEWCQTGLNMADTLDILISQKENCQCLYQGYKGVGNESLALAYYERYHLLEDSTINEQNLTSLISREFQFTYEKDTLAAGLIFKQKEKIKEEISNAELRYEQKQKYWLWAGLGLVALAGLLFFRSYRLKKRDNVIISAQKKEVEFQKAIVDEKNTEIVDSLNYAKTLQDAILPSKEDLLYSFPKHFLLYKPKDIVAGDFYWMVKTNEFIFVAVADCTGHGVPGAMVSVVCSNALNRAVKEFQLSNCGEILDKVTDLVIDRFSQSNKEVRDGMDISLLRFSTHDKTEAQFSGANNSLWVIRKESSEVEIVKADKQPIGLYGARTPFSNQLVKFAAGDRLYMASDGYADQFGGEKGKKMKASNFKAFLLNNQNNSIEKQQDMLLQNLVSWMGDIEQIDDVCVMGIEI